MDIRVNNVYSAYQVYNTSGTGRQRRLGAEHEQSQDTFTMSVQAEDYRVARQAISRLPDVRLDRVEALRSQIDSGQYSVSPAMVADKILRDAYGLS